MFRLLRRIDVAPGTTITALVRQVGLDHSTLGRNVKVPRRHDLVTAEGGVDDRTRVPALTEAGRAALHAALPLWEQAQARMRHALGDRMATVMHGLDEIGALAGRAGAATGSADADPA